MTTRARQPSASSSGDRAARRRHGRCGAALQLIGLASLALLQGACGNYDGAGGVPSGGGTAPVNFADEPETGVDPAAALAAFSSTVYPLTTANCADCHAGAGPGFPNIAHSSAGTAHDAVVNTQKVSFANPASSRLVQRLAVDRHYCWSDCTMDAQTMTAAIAQWAALIQFDAGGGTSVASGITSNSLRLADGVEDEGQQRYLSNVIAFWDFKEGSGEIAHDTSGVAPAMDLRLEGPTWMSSYGIRAEEGGAIVGPESARKLYDRIASDQTGSQQYSIEAWVAPDNVTQEGPARIVSYSRGTGKRNFTLGQTLYNYVFRNRSMAPEIGENGTPELATYDADQDLQATQQHVVVTFDQFRGRRIYVNGRWTDDVDEQGPGRLWTWDPEFPFILGNEAGRSRPWKGAIRLVAIYDHALSEAQIQQNFTAGVGKRVLMTFDISQWGGAGARLEFTVIELDDFSYLFCEPAIIKPGGGDLRLGSLRLLVNGSAAASGQAFTNVDTLVTQPKQQLSRMCSVVPKEQGPDLDEFAVEFELLGQYENFADDPVPEFPPVAFAASTDPDEGVRDFARINDTMAAVTGVDPGLVRATFVDLSEQLPATHDLRAFGSSHQVGVAKLALEYCDAMVESAALRQAYFPGFDFAANADLAFSNETQSDIVIDQLVTQMIGDAVATQPTRQEVEDVVLDPLFAKLIENCDGSNCGPARTRTVVKAGCAAVLSSAAMSVH